MSKASIRKDILHPELSHEIVGALFDVFRELSFGHKEKYYENAVAEALEKRGLHYQRQKRVSLSFAGKEIGYHFLDFLVEDTVVLELKQGNSFSNKNIDQVHSYLKTLNLQLGIIAQFTSDGVKYKL